ncbi:MAG TPA: DsbA family protein, partial [Thermaerobacter sp.]
GSPEAPVTVVEFSDFKCPYCRDFTLEVFPRLKEEYIDTGKVRFYFINYPFLGPDSDTAAIATEAVFAQNPEGVWPFIDAVMEQQGPKDEVWATPEFLVQVAAEAVPGLDRDRLLADLQDERYRDEVERDRRIAERLGVRGTPSLFVNGKFVADWSYEGLKAAIDEALAGTGGSGRAAR